MSDCPNCGSNLQEGWKFCNECGTNLTQALTPSPPSEPTETEFIIRDEPVTPPPSEPKPEIEMKIEEPEQPTKKPTQEKDSGFLKNQKDNIIIASIVFAIVILVLYLVLQNAGISPSLDNPFVEITDTDGDGIEDSKDLFPNDPNEWVDTDGDGVGDNADAFPNDSFETVDSDGDGHGDNSDEFPSDSAEWRDTDSDGVGDNADDFPNDPSETTDSDSDGVGDNTDEFPTDPSETTDTDDDGVGDNADAFPNDPSETTDTDGDGYGDNSDEFPSDPNEWVDTDGDGYGDNADDFPNDPGEHTDSDGDGVGDNADEFPNDPLEWEDTDGDGMGNNGDPFPNDEDNDGFDDDEDYYSGGDAFLLLELTAFKVTDPVDWWPYEEAELYFKIYYDWDSTDEEWDQVNYILNDDGETWSVDEDVYFPIGKDLVFNPPDNEKFYYIVIQAFDEDVSDDDYIDIDGTSQSSKTLFLSYNLETQTWSGDDSDGVADGSEDGTGGSDDDDGILYYDLIIFSIGFEKEYKWNYDGYQFTINIDFNLIDYVINHSKERIAWDCQEYVNSDAYYIITLSDELNNLADQVGYTYYEKVDFVLSFVQNIKYSYDNETTESDEYWRYPIETLVEETGDCEDASFLFASIMEAMGYDAVCLSPPGHMAVGIYAESHSGSYLMYDGRKYYYCETTNPGWEMGELPPNYEGESFSIYPVE